MSENYVKCKCQNILTEEDFIKHFQKCEEFRKYFKTFDTQFGELLKQYADPKENLLIIRVLLKQYVMVLDKKIRASFNGFNSYPVDVNAVNQNIQLGNIGYNTHVNNPNLNNYFNDPNNNLMNVDDNKQFPKDSDKNKNILHNIPNQNVYPINNQNFNTKVNQNVITNISKNDRFQQGMGNNFQFNYGSEYQSRNNNNNNIIPFENNYNNDLINIENNQKKINFTDSMKKNSNPFSQQFDDCIVECCQICRDPNFTYLDECLHTICQICFKDYAKRDLPNMKCVVCQMAISEETKIMILGRAEYEKLEMDFLMGAIGSLNECPQCKEKIVFEKGATDYNIKNEKNEKLSKEAAEHYAANRCRCPSCKIDFCASCKINPYHIGKTCEAAKQHSVAKKCRYDDSVITSKNQGPADDVCNNAECINIYKTACTKVLQCGHKCWGCKGEKNCPPCLEKTCKNYVNKYDQNSDSYCNICFTEGLGNSPVVLLSCNHYVHYKCLETRLKKKWMGPKITFNHCLCPQCNSWVDCPSVPEIQEMINENKNLYDSICKMALERLKFEGLDKDARLTNPNSKWYKNTLQFALNSISYYLCYQCKKPYFAGLRECGENPLVDNNNPNREYDPKDLICGAHANLAGVAGVSECKVHGKDFIEYKCKFCCNIASWFCWGSTHFCEDCHTRQCKGDYVSKYSRDKLPKCNPAKCAVKVKHPENGEEFALGCSVCRNHQENVKNF